MDASELVSEFDDWFGPAGLEIQRRLSYMDSDQMARDAERYQRARAEVKTNGDTRAMYVIQRDTLFHAALRARIALAAAREAIQRGEAWKGTLIETVNSAYDELCAVTTQTGEST